MARSGLVHNRAREAGLGYWIKSKKTMLGWLKAHNILQPEASSVQRGDLVGSEIPLAVFHVRPSKMNDDQKRKVIMLGRPYCRNGFLHEFAALFIGHGYLKFSVAAVLDVFKERDLGDAKTYNWHGKRWRAQKRLSLINSQNRGKSFQRSCASLGSAVTRTPRACNQAVKYSRAK